MRIKTVLIALIVGTTLLRFRHALFLVVKKEV